MIECECCEEYFHADEISSCPECGIELCEGCFQRHVMRCGLNRDMDDNSEGLLNVPTECPECGEKLELDVDYDKTTLMCPECDYDLDVTDEFKNLEDDNEDNEN